MPRGRWRPLQLVCRPKRHLRHVESFCSEIVIFSTIESNLGSTRHVQIRSDSKVRTRLVHGSPASASVCAPHTPIRTACPVSSLSIPTISGRWGSKRSSTSSETDARGACSRTSGSHSSGNPLLEREIWCEGQGCGLREPLGEPCVVRREVYLCVSRMFWEPFAYVGGESGNWGGDTFWDARTTMKQS